MTVKLEKGQIWAKYANYPVEIIDFDKITVDLFQERTVLLFKLPLAEFVADYTGPYKPKEKPENPTKKNAFQILAKAILEISGNAVTGFDDDQEFLESKGCLSDHTQKLVEEIAEFE